MNELFQLITVTQTHTVQIQMNQTQILSAHVTMNLLKTE